MANDISALEPFLFEAARIVPRELTGFIPSVTTDFNAKGVAVGDTVSTPVIPKPTVSTTSTANVWPTGNSTTAGKRTLTLEQEAEVSWHLTAEEERSLINGGNLNDTLSQMFQQGIRELVNPIEAYIATVAYQSANSAIGTAATTPFGSDLSDANEMKKALDDLGCPKTGRSLVINTDAGLNLRNLTQLTNANQAATDSTLRAGDLLPLSGLAIRESDGVQSHTKGTGTSYVTSGATAVDVEDIALITGSGTVLAGDVVTFAADSVNKYVIETGVTAPGTISLGAPGARVVIADANAMTIGANYTANVGLHKAGVAAVIRPTLQPESGAWEQSIITDPESGLSFLFVRVPQKGQTSWFMSVVYDAYAPNPEFIVNLMG